jgi:hypothetical protein
MAGVPANRRPDSIPLRCGNQNLLAEQREPPGVSRECVAPGDQTPRAVPLKFNRIACSRWACSQAPRMNRVF